MKFEVDQSGRVEETQRDTVIAFADKNDDYSLRISAKTKRALQRYFKKAGKPKLFAVKVFALGVAIAIKKSKIKIRSLVIDIEYPGYESVISGIISHELNTGFQIQFKKIGKESPAHKKAYFTFRRKIKENYLAKEEEFGRALKN